MKRSTTMPHCVRHNPSPFGLAGSASVVLRSYRTVPRRTVPSHTRHTLQGTIKSGPCGNAPLGGFTTLAVLRPICCRHVTKFMSCVKYMRPCCDRLISCAREVGYVFNCQRPGDPKWVMYGQRKRAHKV